MENNLIMKLLCCLGVLGVAVCGRQPLFAFQELMPAPYQRFDVRIKDITTIEGERTNRLIGMGLVTGLNQTGGTNPETRDFHLRILEQLGSRADPLQRLNILNNSRTKTNNVSVVTVTAELPAHVRKGSEINVSVAAFDNASSLQNGELISTPLYGYDGNVYVMAGGKITIGGGFTASGDAASVTKNHPTSGHVIRGGQVERVVCEQELGTTGFVNFLLHQSDFETARRVADEIDRVAPRAANVVDARVIQVKIPQEYATDVFSFVSMINNLRVVPDVKARVVINERTGTIVVGDNVRLSRVGITHANLSVITGESPQVSQPNPLSKGETTVVPRTTIDVVEGTNPLQVIENSATVGELAKALNALGASPRDLSAIFQQLNRSGALHAELIFD